MKQQKHAKPRLLFYFHFKMWKLLWCGACFVWKIQHFVVIIETVNVDYMKLILIMRQ